MEVHPSARRHQIPDSDIDHAYDHAIAWVELGDDPLRCLVVGGDRAGNLLEMVALERDDDVIVIHAMRLRLNTQREIFGDEL